MWIISFMGETWINHCVHALRTESPHSRGALCIFPIGKKKKEEKNFFLKRKRMLQLRVAKDWMLAVGRPQDQGRCPESGVLQLRFS